jgi:hypothetical protein
LGAAPAVARANAEQFLRDQRVAHGAAVDRRSKPVPANVG